MQLFFLLKTRRIREERGADAMYSLGILYSTGDGVPLDLVQAHMWFNLAAMMGNAGAREWRAELAAEMSQLDVANAQKQARSWIADGKAATKEDQIEEHEDA